MARRSNKTAHVLNLIAGHEVPKEETEEIIAAGETPASADHTAAEAGSAAPVLPAAPAQNISVIDTTEKDPVADLIQQKLSDVLNEENPGSPDATASAPPEQEMPPADATSKATESESVSQAVPHTAAPGPQASPAPNTASAPQTAPEPESVPQAPPEIVSQNDTAPQASSEIISQDDIAPQAPSEIISQDDTTPQAPSEIVSQDDTVPEPEPAFAAVNVMERIVQDKIIYYMRQFDVCTCDRCVADTVALTLNGLMPKYIVTMPSAVDPLLSYYTNRLISDVTVEATKACVIVKDHPRH